MTTTRHLAGAPEAEAPGLRRSVLARARDERGVALIIALFATILLTALGVALVLFSNTETIITLACRCMIAHSEEVSDQWN